MQQTTRKMAAAAALWLAALGLTGLSSNVTGLTLTRTGVPPRIDGILDDACWKDAAVIDQLNILEQPGKTSSEHKIHVAFDDQWLYVAYDIHQPESQRKSPVFTRHDDFVQREDCVKLSFDPGTAGAIYYHFKLNRANARREQKVTRAKGQTTGRQNVENWNIPWRSAVRDNPDGWTAEVAVPLSLLAPAGKLAHARINLLATRYVVVTRDIAVNIATTERESLSAAPLQTSFDEPEHFIPVKGMETLKVQSAFLPFIENIRVSPYRGEAGNYFYDVSIDLKQCGKVAGKVKLEYEDQPADGKSQIVEQALDMAGTPGTTAVTMIIPVAGFSARKGQLRLRDAAAGEIWQSEPLADNEMAALNNLFSAYLDRSYYTDEKHARVICSIGLPEESLEKMKLVVAASAGRGIPEPRSSQPGWDKSQPGWDKPPAAAAESGRILAQAGKSAAHAPSWWRRLLLPPAPDAGLHSEMELKIPLASVALGATPVTVQLLQADDTAMFAQTLELTKRPSNPGCEWKIDHENRIVLRNGKPFFLHGVNLPLTWVGGDPEIAMHDISEMGFNAILFNDSYNKWLKGHGLDPTNTAYLDLAQKHNLLVMPWMESYDAPRTNYNGTLVSLHFALIREKRFAPMDYSAKTKFWEDAFHYQLPRYLAAAEHAKHHPNLIGYFIFDEPVPKDKYDQISSGHQFYRKLHETDGYHPVMVNYCHLPEGEEYVNWCDVLVVDPYWVPPGQPNRVSRFTAQAWRRATPRRNPVWSVPCGELWSFIYKRPIAPNENLCQTYLALIHGAKGLWYFTYNFKYQFTADGFKIVNRHLDTLGPIVVAHPVKQVINNGQGNFNDIQAALFRHPDGGYVLLAANRCEYPVDAVFTLSNLDEGENVRQLFAADWSAAVTAGSFGDHFEPFGVRAYTFHGLRTTDHGSRTKPRTTDHLTTISIAITPHPDKVTPEPLISATGRPGKRNLVQNPGFELITLPGTPDYYPMSAHLGSGPRFGLPGAYAGLDKEKPFEGKYSLRLQCVKPKRPSNMLTFGLAPQCDQPTPFVCSFYMRSDCDGAEVRIQYRNQKFGDGKPLVLTRDWQRYHKAGEIGPGSATAWENKFVITVKPPANADECTVWIDAVQVERGAAPTEYEP